MQPIPVMIPGRMVHMQLEFKKIQIAKITFKGVAWVFNDIVLIAKCSNKRKLKYIAHCNMRFLEVTVTKEKNSLLLPPSLPFGFSHKGRLQG